MNKIKKYLYNLYYDFIMWLEDKSCRLTTIINNHRRRLDGEKQYIDHDGYKQWR